MSKRKTPQSEVPRPTQEEILDKTEFVRMLVAKGWLKSKIKAAFRLKYGPTKEDPGKLVPSAGTIEDYLRRAKDQMAERVAAGTAEQRNVLGEVIWDILASDKSKNLEKLKAAEIYAKLHGLNAPLQTEIGGIGGGPITTAAIDVANLTAEDRQAILAADAVLSRDDPVHGAVHPNGRGASLPSGNGHPDK